VGEHVERVRREVRWFVDGDVGRELRPRGRSRRRIDRYDLHSLRPWSSVKRRGPGGNLERKARVGSVELTTLGGLSGLRAFAETWAKTAAGPLRTDGTWLEVDKELWTDRELEIGTYRVGMQRGWTICIDLDRPLSRSTLGALESWAPLLERRGHCSSYAAWLGQHHRRPLAATASTE